MQLAVKAKLYIPSTIIISRKLLTAAIWADKNGLVSGRLACTPSETQNIKKIIEIKIQFKLECILTPKLEKRKK
jgi:hypothetical protein